MLFDHVRGKKAVEVTEIVQYGSWYDGLRPSTTQYTRKSKFFFRVLTLLITVKRSVAEIEWFEMSSS